MGSVISINNNNPVYFCMIVNESKAENGNVSIQEKDGKRRVYLETNSFEKMEKLTEAVKDYIAHNSFSDVPQFYDPDDLIQIYDSKKILN